MDEVKEKILSILKNGEKTTYQIAKEIGTSYSTIKIRLLELLNEGKVEKSAKLIGLQKKVYWRLKN